MGLKADPIGGGRFQAALQSIIEVERQPIKQLEVRKSKEEQRMKLFQEFKGKVNDLQSAVEAISNFKKLVELKVDLGDGANLMEVTLDKEKAQPGSYEVVINELAARSSMISNGFPDPNEPVIGMGYVVVYKNDGETFEIFVDEKESSLVNIANKINKAQDSPVRASVVQDEYDPKNPWKLIVTAKSDGERESVVFPEFYFMDAKKDFWIDDDHESANAYLKLDGFELELPSNKVADFLQGVNVRLKQARPDTPFTMTITEDHEKITGKVKAVIEKANGVLEWINKQNSVDEKTDTSNTFSGDTSLQTVEYRLRNLAHEGFPVGDYEDNFRLKFLYEMGINFNKKGALSFDESKFKNALEKDFEGVAEALSGEYGFSYQLAEVLKGYTRGIDGLIVNRERGLQNRIRAIDDNISNKQRQLDIKQNALVQKFSRLQSTLGALQQQQAYLSATLGGGGGGNLVAQLLGG